MASINPYIKCMMYLQRINDIRTNYEKHMNYAITNMDVLTREEQFNLAVITYEHMEDLLKLSKELDDYIVKKHKELKDIVGETNYIRMSAKSMELVEVIKKIEREWDEL